MSAIPQDISRDEWLQALPRALVVGFVKTDIEFQQKGREGIFFDCVILRASLEFSCMLILTF